MKLPFLLLILFCFARSMQAQLNVPEGTVGNSDNSNVGIDVVEPKEKFQIGNKWTFHDGGHKVIGFNTYHNSMQNRRVTDGVSSCVRFTDYGAIQFGTAPLGVAESVISWAVPLFLSNAGSVGLGTLEPDGLQVNTTLSDENSRGVTNVRIGVMANTPRIIFDYAHHVPFEMDNFAGMFRIYTPGIERLVIHPNGNVGIGTINPGSFKLAVEGKIGAREVNVTLANPWPDYVFENDYKLPPLAEVERYVKQHKHLPDVPSAKTVGENGINLSEMNTILLKKVEELTLYLIELKKANEALRGRVEDLERKK